MADSRSLKQPWAKPETDPQERLARSLVAHSADVATLEALLRKTRLGARMARLVGQNSHES